MSHVSSVIALLWQEGAQKISSPGEFSVFESCSCLVLEFHPMHTQIDTQPKTQGDPMQISGSLSVQLSSLGLLSQIPAILVFFISDLHPVSEIT